MSVSINQQHVRRDVIVVGASAGGIHAVIEFLSRLPADLPAFMGVVIHRGAASTSSWAGVLGMKTGLRVVEPASGEPLKPGVVYVAPADGDALVLLSRGGTVPVAAAEISRG